MGGDVNLLAYVSGMPGVFVDPLGLQSGMTMEEYLRHEGQRQKQYIDFKAAGQKIERAAIVVNAVEEVAGGTAVDALYLVDDMRDSFSGQMALIEEMCEDACDSDAGTFKIYSLSILAQGTELYQGKPKKAIDTGTDLAFIFRAAGTKFLQWRLKKAAARSARNAVARQGAEQGAQKGGRDAAKELAEETGECAPKRGPKPFGTGPHNIKIKEVADSIADGDVIAGGQIPGLPEAVIKTPGGIMSSRRPDILVRRADGSQYGINVGKTTKNGAPIKREAEAIADLEDAGLEMHFVPYD